MKIALRRFADETFWVGEVATLHFRESTSIEWIGFDGIEHCTLVTLTELPHHLERDTEGNVWVRPNEYHAEGMELLWEKEEEQK